MNSEQSTTTGPADGEMIVGSVVRPGDKPEVAEVMPVEGNDALSTLDQLNVSANSQPIFAAREAADVTPPVSQSATSTLPAVGHRPDGSELDRGERLLAALGYIGILALVPLLLRRDSAYCRHHGSQGLVLGAVLTVAEAVANLLGLILPGFHGFIVVLMLIAWIAGFALAFAGNWFRIPVVADWADQLNLFATNMDRDTRLQNESNA